MNRVLTKQSVYMYPNTEARSYSHCGSGKAVRFTYSECVFVAPMMLPAGSIIGTLYHKL